jgi:membrane protease YdiL (CAAX protease family)
MIATEGGGRPAVRQELRRVRLPANATWLAVAIAVPFSVVVLAVFLARWQGDATQYITGSAFPMMFGIQLLTGAVGEELGWRGFLLPRLRSFVGVKPSWWLMATLWSLWHVAGMFFPGTPLQVAPPVPLLLSIGLFGVFLGFLFDTAGESVLATILAHLSLNVALGVGGVPPTSHWFWWTMAATLGACALVVTLRSPRAEGT